VRPDYQARHNESDGGNYGWMLQTNGRWTFKAPAIPSGPDKEGWGRFIVGEIWHGSFSGLWLALDFGCHWEGNNREWDPAWQECRSFETAQDWIESRLISRGILIGENHAA
jgi:hypothetical protein